MQLRDIYKKDINRSINGVIKVVQNDEEIIKQELEEYVVTQELRKLFNTFLENYEKSLYNATDKVGVWISGFFGSGKSHFLKILSYLLSNKVVAGKKAVDYFSDKFDDPLMFAQLEECASVPTETILFNVDSKSSINRDNTAIFKVFLQEFYEHQGFYGSDVKVAKLEQYLQKQGKLQEFKDKFFNVHGDSWDDCRASYQFFSDEVTQVMGEVLNMSEAAVSNWMNDSDPNISIHDFANEVKEYIDSKGKNARLLFMVDEIGQYIGDNTSLMLNLQTIVEELGSICGGRVWVMVTSQEAIDEVTAVKGNDFSKIQGRFNTRISLSSSSVDEVIKKRILAKNDNATNMLRLSYDKNSAILKNLITFNGAVADLKGYMGENEFIETYPFVPYQFKLMINVFKEIRKHGNSGKHLSEGERSMLSGFQESAQAIEDKDENALVPFWLFYDTISTFLDSGIRRVIDRCQKAADNHDGLEEYDVQVLKLLYLIRYINDVKANLENITTLMVDDIRADKINTKMNISESLARLEQQNYIARNGDTYSFLTDDEQDVEREIANTAVDTANITKSISDIIFGEIYPNNKYSYNKNAFTYDQKVDETYRSQSSGVIQLRIVTEIGDLNNADEHTLLMNSMNNVAILKLESEHSYYKDLLEAKRIRNYIKTRNVSQLLENIQTIINGKQKQATRLENEAKRYIEEAIKNAKLYVCNDFINRPFSSAKEKIDFALKTLIENVYTKLNYIEVNYTDERELLTLLTPKNFVYDLDGAVGTTNKEAIKEVDQYLQLQDSRNMPTSMGDIQKRYLAAPYGWRDIDIASIICTLIAYKKIDIQYSGTMISSSDKKIVEYLRNRSCIDKTIVKRKVSIPDKLKNRAREVLRQYFNLTGVSSEDDKLVEQIIDNFQKERDNFHGLLDKYYVYNNYPDKDVLVNGINLIDSLLVQKKDNIALLNKLVEIEDDLYDLNEDKEDVESFFKNQKNIYDSAVNLLKSLEHETEYLKDNTDALIAIDRIKEILSMKKPYKCISELPNLIQEVNNVYFNLLIEKRKEIANLIDNILEDIRNSANSDQTEIINKAENDFNSRKNSVNNLDTLTQLDALKVQLASLRQYYLTSLAKSTDKEADTVTVERSSICNSVKLENEEDIDKYVSEIKEKLMDELKGHDALHII